MSRPKRWQQDKRFVSFLLEKQYARQDGKKLVPLLTEGQCIYMWEAFLEGQTLTRKKQ